MVNLTWASRCDKVMFVTDLEDPSLPTMVVDLSGRDKLWGKTKMMFDKTANYSMEFDWILKVRIFVVIEIYLCAVRSLP